MFDGKYTGYFDGTYCASEMRWIGVEQTLVNGILLESSNWFPSDLVKNGGYIDNKSAKKPRHDKLKSCEASADTKPKINTTHHPSKSINKTNSKPTVYYTQNYPYTTHPTTKNPHIIALLAFLAFLAFFSSAS